MNWFISLQTEQTLFFCIHADHLSHRTFIVFPVGRVFETGSGWEGSLGGQAGAGRCVRWVLLHLMGKLRPACQYEAVPRAGQDQSGVGGAVSGHQCLSRGCFQMAFIIVVVARAHDRDQTLWPTACDSDLLCALLPHPHSFSQLLLSVCFLRSSGYSPCPL